MVQRSVIASNGYRRLGKLWEHRVVLRAVIGQDPHPCAWCNRILHWGVDLHVDHLDFDKLNNDPRNLVPSCQPCNNRRARNWRRRKTHCIKGHEYTELNTGLNLISGGRVCRTCHRDICRRYDARRRAERSGAAMAAAVKQQRRAA